MKDGFIKIACATPNLKVADVEYNASEIVENIKKANALGVKIVCFPELCVTGYTCGDLFLQDALLRGAIEAVETIASKTAGLDTLSIVGLPYQVKNKLYNIAVVIKGGKVIGATAKKFIPNYSEFYELRHFTPATDDLIEEISFGQAGSTVLCSNHIFACKELQNLRFGIEIC
ncbi:MAG: NAD(+) synthase, partial [Pseudobutyrivibrio sp.]|nr:NAD(+) synthase [Pseudobutyrivibrio sp.]